MRAILEAVTLAALAFLIIITGLALYGSNRLPQPVPSHVDVSGHVDEWTTRSSFATLPLLAVAAYLIFSFAATLSSIAKHEPDAPPEHGQAPESMILSLITWIKAELIGIFACIQYSALQFARHPEDGSSLLGVWILVAAVFCTLAWHITVMFRARRAAQQAVNSPNASQP